MAAGNSPSPTGGGDTALTTGHGGRGPGGAGSPVPGGGALPPGDPTGSPPPLLPVAGAAALGGLTLTGAFIFLVRRRQKPAATAEVPAVAATWAPAFPTGVVTAAVAATRPATVLPPDTPIEEAMIPRWRRPSLHAARQLSVRGAPLEHVPVAFFEPAASGADRRRVQYRLVRLSSEPDELRGEEVGRLDRGDEVSVLETRGGYCLVETPLGAVGWVHRMTLEDPSRARTSDGDDEGD